MSGLTDSTPVAGGGSSGDHLETGVDPSRPPTGPQSQASGLRFAGKRQVTIQNLDLTPLRLDDPPSHHTSTSSNTNTNPSSKPTRVRLPPLTSIGAAEASTDNFSVLRHDRSGANKPNDRMSTGPVDLAAAQRQLDDQQLDDSQRERIEEFLRYKKDIHELHPEDFTKISELGSGNWGVVSRVRYNRTNIIMAKKTIRLDIKHEVGTQILRELEILHDCASPYIIGFYGAFLADGNINICMEYMDGGSLDMVLKHAGRMPEPIVSRILYAVLCGLEYLRKQLSMIHRDVKPSNILMRRNGEIKLCDFGASGKLIDSVAHSFVGSRSYMAPERISGQSYNTSSDVWSLGLTLIELATGRYPIPAIENETQYYTGFSNDRQTNLKEHIAAAREGRKLPPVTTLEQAPLSIFELLVLIVEQPLPRLPRTCFSDDFIDLVASCLRTESVERPSLEVLQNHAFVATVAGLVPAGANRRSSIRFRDFPTAATARNAPCGSQDTNVDLNMDDIAFYLSHILPPHDGIG
ncbi:dual specificity mitogen activated protein [Echinococcus multilocularis]|uniref:mitogen-activated protein kinase kinase n=1 Tax=Echinococcus multilocularis TaxID=6211 RepID=A0A068Y6N7_ECHMU|nr:dual specificity mitogen activated protein [Echinococcus multilocularis]